MRKECRKRGIERLTVLSSNEEPRALPVTGCDGTTGDEQGAPSAGKPALGTVSYLPPIMGQMIAGHVIRQLVEGIPETAAPRLVARRGSRNQEHAR
jgi:tRNA A37 threonylcarbamoyladenosine dehydratase